VLDGEGDCSGFQLVANRLVMNCVNVKT
jgi:hypothetical protein